MRTFALCASALTLAAGLAACSPSADEQAAPAASETAVAASQPAPAATPAPSDTAIAPAATNTIPAAFHGTWDYIKGTCNPQSDARQEIAAKSVEFYESQGTVTTVEVDSPTRVVVSLAMAGEGETWQSSTLYALSADGNRLTTQPVNEDSNPPFEMKRCS